MKTPEAYRAADRCQERLTKRALKRLNDAKRKLRILKFDELNALNTVDALYAGLYRDALTQYRMLYLERYREVTRQSGRKEPDEDDLDELAGMWLTGFLHEANETTKYAYESELIRKRDRAKEALKAVPTKVQKQLEMENAVRYVIHQDAYYTDMASQDAELQALKDAGVKKVIRMESDDEKTCTTCRKLKGKIYEIGKVPPLEHIHCRRWFLPYSGKAERI